MPSDTAWRRVLPFKNVEAARIRFLSMAESQRLINGADAEFRPLLIAALQTGARYQELARLKVADFNVDSGTVAIWVSKSGKPRHIVLTDEGADFFKQQTAGRASADLLLPRADGTAWGRSHQQRKMQAACQRAHVEPAIGIHTLRHTWASLAVMAGMPLMIVAKNLGHASTRMTERHYAHLAPSSRHSHAATFYFRNLKKPLILNRVNFDSLAEISGELDSENWGGARCELYPAVTEVGGKSTVRREFRKPSAAAKTATPAAKPKEPEPAPEPDPCKTFFGSGNGPDMEQPSFDEDEVRAR